jgi:hypothetical protein
MKVEMGQKIVKDNRQPAWGQLLCQGLANVTRSVNKQYVGYRKETEIAGNLSCY